MFLLLPRLCTEKKKIVKSLLFGCFIEKFIKGLFEIKIIKSEISCSSYSVCFVRINITSVSRVGEGHLQAI